MAEVERISGIDRAGFAVRHDLLERPVVIDGGALPSPACASWTPERLIEKVGGVSIAYKVSATHRHPNFDAPSLAEAFARERGTVAELIQLVTSGPVEQRSRYLFTGDERFLLRRREGKTERDPELGVLLDDVVMPPLFAEERLYSVWGWISGPGVRTWLHYDNNGCHNLNAQLTGHKRCTLYPPSSLSAMRPFVLGGANPAHNCSSLDVETTRSLDDIESYDAELRAGDLLFIPAYWFHTFLHTGDFNTNVNFWYRPERPGHNAVAARQALLDAAGRASVKSDPSSPEAALLRALDGALIG